MNYTKSTHNINVTVSSVYQDAVSEPEEDYHVFSYDVMIENEGQEPIQVMGRNWYIVDGLGQTRVVTGEGVVGETPIIEVGEAFEYNSWCELHTEVGKMWGSYLVKRLSDGLEYEVSIPVFMLLPHFRLN
ncbi:MAG: ApaG protein [Bacteroidia bacterium]|jgi:ApaG protein